MFNNETNIPTTGLVASYDLDGDATDRSGGGNDGTATNVAWVASDKGYTSEVGSFNGSSSYVLLNETITATDTFYFTTTINTNETVNTGLVVNVKIGTSSFQGLFINRDGSGEITFRHYDNSVAISITGTLETSKDLFVECIYNNGGKAQLYVNQVLLAERTLNNPNDLSEIIAIGRSNPNAADYYDGKAGLLKVYNRIPSQEERNNLYNEGLRRLGPSNHTLSGSFPKYSLPNLEEGKVLEISRPVSGGLYIDQTGNGNNGTPTNVTDSTLGLNNVMSFNGTSSKIDTNYTLSGSTSTISFNYKHTANGTDDWIISQYGDGTPSGRWGLGVQTDNKLFLLQNPGSVITITSPTVLQVGKTYSIQIVRYSVDLWELFVDGVSQGTDTGGLSLPAATINLMELVGTFQVGEMSNFNIHTRVLSQEEILEDYYSNYIPN